jgi:uncharacterized membrane protein YfcA
MDDERSESSVLNVGRRLVAGHRDHERREGARGGGEEDRSPGAHAVHGTGGRRDGEQRHKLSTPNRVRLRPVSLSEFLILIVLGLAAGALGGLLGIGGSVLMIPVLTLVLGRDQHVSQAAAMIVNVFVALPGVFRHHLAVAIEWPVVRRMIPAGLVFILAGVALSNTLDAHVLGTIFGVFLLSYVASAPILRALRGRRDDGDAAPRAGWLHAGGVGAIAGLAAGLLGIGGGVIAVPLLHLLCRLPLRRAIAASATMMCVTSIFGAAAKNLTLARLDLDVAQSLLIAACLVPTAIAGGLYGAGLTHSLPLKWVRLVLHVLLLVAAVKFLRLF